ncbi:MAG: redoxin domain-containing protein [Lachnospiraceae bacterium]|nr:redoxin domain-containing protein [Lachnospiraceae bacterium]
MQYIVSFLEGIITFISPCLLPMLPIYISYFAGESSDEAEPGTKMKSRTLKNAFGFVVGFSIVFVVLGALAGSLGQLLTKYQNAVNIVCGLIIIIFGLNFCGVLKISVLNMTKKPDVDVKGTGFFRAVLFGIVFSVGWSPCVGTFLGSALLMASQEGTVLQGVLMLVCYSIGLGVPFIISALLIDKLKHAFQVIKNHYKAINICAGVFLVAIGLFMVAEGISGYQKRIEMLENTMEEEVDQTEANDDTVMAPDFQIEDADGNMISLSSLQGKPVILNFWASWCPPCKSEMPDFQAAYDAYGEDIQFVMVNLTDGNRETKETASAFIQESGFTFPVYYDVNMEAAYAYNVSSVPLTLLIGSDGTVVAHHVGMLDATGLQQGIDRLLEVSGIEKE